MIKLKKDYEFMVIDEFGTVYHYAETKGLAFQWISKKSLPNRKRIKTGEINNVLDRIYIVKEIKKEVKKTII